jgi:hypothetical protein
MTTSHTPGPWTYDQEEDNSTDFWVFQTNGPARIACEVSERDAALIAAAPDLLAALIEAVKHAQPLPAPLGSPLTEHAGVWPDWVIAARAAIARATGA